jgi:ComF family protein
LIYKLKFARARAAADAIAAVMGEALPYFSDPVIVTHVPTATRRIRQRGYDHAQLIAKALARQQGLTYSSLLARQGQTRQVGADKKTRSQQLEAAFRPLHGYMSAGAHILLIDDVVTTGASLEAAARVLKQAGAKQIDAAVFAQKL